MVSEKMSKHERDYRENTVVLDAKGKPDADSSPYIILPSAMFVE